MNAFIFLNDQTNLSKLLRISEQQYIHIILTCTCNSYSLKVKFRGGGGGCAPRGIKKMISKFSLTAQNKKFAVVFANNICMNAQVIKR